MKKLHGAFAYNLLSTVLYSRFQNKGHTDSYCTMLAGPKKGVAGLSAQC